MRVERASRRVLVTVALSAALLLLALSHPSWAGPGLWAQRRSR